jgi:hypothetical protein
MHTYALGKKASLKRVADAWTVDVTGLIDI